MKNSVSFLKLTTVLSLFIQFTVSPQTRGLTSEIRQAFLRSNEITTVIFNYGAIGKPNYLGNLADLAYKGLGYMFDFGPVVGTKVLSANGDSVIIFSDPQILASQGDYDPTGTLKWGWLPRAGFANPLSNEFASKSKPETWPTDWTEWPEDSAFTGSLDEVYFVMDDFTNREFLYFPSSDDTSMRGLGLSCEVRMMQFGGNLANSLILKYRLKNEGTNPLNNLWFSFYGDPHIGGPGDYADDALEYYSNPYSPRYPNTSGFIHCLDRDGIGFSSLKTYSLNFVPLDGFGENKIASLYAENYGILFPKDDSAFYSALERGLNARDTIIGEMDYMLVFSGEKFSLSPGETKDFVLGLVFADGLIKSLEKVSEIRHHYLWREMQITPSAFGGNLDHSFDITQFPTGEQSGNISLSWAYTGVSPNSKLFIEISSNSGETWLAVEDDLPVNGSYSLQSENYLDGRNYLVRLVAYNSVDRTKYYYKVVPEKFTINNAINAQPEIQLITNFEDLTVSRLPFTFEVNCEDADNSILNYSLYYQIADDSAFIPVTLHKNVDAGVNQIVLPEGNLPNRSTYKLKFVLSDGIVDTSITTRQFTIERDAGFYPENTVFHKTGFSDAVLRPAIVDHRGIIYGSEYEITFSNLPQKDSVGFVSVKNLNTGNVLLDKEKLSPFGSTSPFENIYLDIFDVPTKINYSQTGFTDTSLNIYFTTTFPPIVGSPSRHKKAAEDWILVFNSLDTNSQGNYLFPADTMTNQLLNPLVTPFRLKSLTFNKDVKCLIFEPASTRNGKWDKEESLILRPTILQGEFDVSWQINFSFPTDIAPTAGDTLFISTLKGLSPADTFLFRADSNFILTSITGNSLMPKTNILYNNYPNPFNPATTIKFALINNANVELKVYDILGREVGNLLSGEVTAGEHTVQFDANSLASGVYIYQLKVNGSSMQARKMLLLR